MWFDIIKDNKRTQYYREFLQAATQLGDLIDSPDNIKAYYNFTGDKRPEYGDRRHLALLKSYDFKIVCRANDEQDMVISKTLPLGEMSREAPENNKQYNLFVIKMFKTEYPELYTKIWDFALFYNKIVNPNLLGKEADKQRALFEGADKDDNSMELLESNLAHTYNFISYFLRLIRQRTSTLFPPSRINLLPENHKAPLLHIIDTTNVLVPLGKFVSQLSTFPRIEDTNETSTSFALKSVLYTTYLKTVTDYIMDNWWTIMNSMKTEYSTPDPPNIKTTPLRGNVQVEATLFYTHWLENYQKLHEEEIEKYIEEILNPPEEDLGDWEDDSLFT